MTGTASELLAQIRTLSRYADRAGIEMANPHHDTPHRHQRRSGETELLRTEQGSDHHIAAGLELAVGLNDDTTAQIVEYQGLMGLRQPQLPGQAGVLDTGLGRCSRAAVVPGNQHHIGVALSHPGRYSANPELGNQLDVDPRIDVGIFEIVDQLCQIFYRIDIVVWWRRN